MKKHSKLIRGIGLAVLLAAVFLSLSLNDVVRLNPQMEGVKDAQAASTAKQTDVDETIAVLVSPEGVPETIEPAEATETWNAEGLETIDADGDGTVVIEQQDYQEYGNYFAISGASGGGKYDGKYDGKGGKGCSCAVGYSILNRTSRVNVVSLMLKYGGGGHMAVGTCQFNDENAKEMVPMLLDELVHYDKYYPHT